VWMSTLRVFVACVRSWISRHRVTRTIETRLTALLLAMPFAAQAQDSIPRARVALLCAESPSTNEHLLDAFRQGLREHGYLGITIPRPLLVRADEVIQ
jgi:hypothetical protein